MIKSQKLFISSNRMLTGRRLQIQIYSLFGPNVCMAILYVSLSQDTDATGFRGL